MCKAKPLEVVAAIANPAMGIAMYTQRKQQEEMASAQESAINSQNQKDADLRKQADEIGPGAKSLDLTKDASVYRQAKKNKIAMQQGILGTMKSSSLSAAPVATQKVTLGT